MTRLKLKTMSIKNDNIQVDLPMNSMIEGPSFRLSDEIVMLTSNTNNDHRRVFDSLKIAISELYI